MPSAPHHPTLDATKDPSVRSVDGGGGAGPGIVVLPGRSDDAATQRRRCERLRAAGFLAVSLPPASAYDLDAVVAAIEDVVAAPSVRDSAGLAALIVSDAPACETWVVASSSTLLLAALVDGSVAGARLRRPRTADPDARPDPRWSPAQFPPDGMLHYFESTHIADGSANDLLLGWDRAVEAVKEFLS
jgi:hypothetical protein